MYVQVINRHVFQILRIDWEITFPKERPKIKNNAENGIIHRDK